MPTEKELLAEGPATVSQYSWAGVSSRSTEELGVQASRSLEGLGFYSGWNGGPWRDWSCAVL